MNPAKLRRSWDVSEHDPIKIEINSEIRDLDAQGRVLAVRREGNEYVQQVADTIAKLQLTGAHPIHCHHTYLVEGSATARPCRRGPVL